MALSTSAFFIPPFRVFPQLRSRLPSNRHPAVLRMDVSDPGTRPSGPHCPLLTQSLLKRHVEVLAVKNRRKLEERSNFQEKPFSKNVARQHLQKRERGQAEWTYTYLIREHIFAKRATDVAEALFALALVAQKRDVPLARYCFKLAVRNAPQYDSRVQAKYLVAWGLLESRQKGGMGNAQRLLMRAVRLDKSKTPVLKWKLIWKD